MSNVRLPTTHEAVRELASRQDTLVLQLLADVAAGDDQFLRRTALEVIGNHPQGRSMQAVILKALSDTSGYVVRTACDIAGKWEIREAHDLVLALLTDASGPTRQTALRALSKVWRDADFPVVFQVYERDADVRVRREAAWVLRKYAAPENWRKLFEAFLVDELARHRQWACEIAEKFSDPEMLPQLLSRLTFDSNGHVRKAASRAINITSTTEG
jgi:HEAT repeat protein